MFVKDSKERRLSINLNFNEFFFNCKQEDQKFSLKLNRPNYNNNIEYPKQISSTYVTFFSMELKWNDVTLISVYNLRQIESRAQSEFQMLQIDPKLDTNFIFNLIEETTEQNRMKIYTKNSCVNSMECLVELHELLANMSAINSYISNLSALFGKSVPRQQTNEISSEEISYQRKSISGQNKHLTAWKIEFIQNSFKFLLKKPALPGNSAYTLIIS